MVRCFIGIWIPEDLKNHVIDIQKQMSGLPIQSKLVEKDNLHISLSFLGEKREDEINSIKGVLDSVTINYPKFMMNIDNIKLIPHEGHVRVIALDVNDEQLFLKSLDRDIYEKIGGDVKPPHLTLMRVKNVLDKNMFLESVKKMNFQKIPFEVNSIFLIKSELGKMGPVYSNIHESKFSVE